MPIITDRLDALRTFARAATFFLIVAALYLSLADIRETPGLDLTWDKLNHSLGYFLLIGFADLGFRTGNRLALKTGLVFSYGLSLEVAQYFLPYREFSIPDLAANGLGILFFLFLRLGLKHLPVYRDLQETASPAIHS